MISDHTLLKVLYRREKSLLGRTPEARRRARRLEGLLRRALRLRERQFPAAGGHLEKLFLIMTRACQLRCRYCPMTKSGRAMPEGVLKRGLELFFAGEGTRLQLHFFGGEPLLRFDQMRRAVRIAEALRARTGKQVRYLVTTNGLNLSDAMIGFFRRHRFTVVMSADGSEKTFGLQRPGVRGGNYYGRARSALEKLKDSGVSYYITAVVSPESAGRLPENVRHLVSLGHKKIEITYEVGREWPPKAVAELLRGVGFLMEEARRTRGFEIVNATDLRWEPVVLKSEMALDVDGGLYRHVGILLEKRKLAKEDFFVASIDSLRTMDDRAFSPFDDFMILARAYRRRNAALRRVVVNNIEVGWALERFLRTRGPRKNSARVSEKFVGRS
ncbi:MAG: radical SAM protein [Elusimicrobiota bacterium]